MKLRAGERCPLHGGYYCCGRKQKPSLRSRGPVQRIPDPHHPRGYREICTPAELRRRTLEKVQKQNKLCAICREPFLSMDEVTDDHILPKKMGASERDDHRDNLQAVHYVCNGAKGSIRNYEPPDRKTQAAGKENSLDV